jgi:hypothetical protein
VAVTGPLAGKLTGAEKNDASAWLPAKVESTKVLDVQSRFQSPNIFTAVVVYDRPSGLTSADKGKTAADARRFADVAGVVRSQLTGPVPSADGKALETVVPVNLGPNGWNSAAATTARLRTIAQANASGLTSHIAGPLGNAADSANAFKGIDGILLVLDPLTTLLGMATRAVCTSRFGEGGPAVTPAMLWMCLAPSDAATERTFAESARVSLPPSARENTMMAADAVTCPACGNALSCRFAARIDS